MESKKQPSKYLDDILEKYAKLRVIINGKETTSGPITEEQIKEHQEKFARLFYQSAVNDYNTLPDDSPYKTMKSVINGKPKE